VREVGRVGELIVGVGFVCFSVEGDGEGDGVGGVERLGVLESVRDLNVWVRVDELGDSRTRSSAICTH